MKKLCAMLLAGCLAFGLVACSGGDTTQAPAATSETSAEAGTPAEASSTEPAAAGDTAPISVFWYTFSDAYLSSVRASLNSALDGAGIAYQDYDSNNSQTTQTEQVQTAIAQGTSALVVNLVDSSSDDAAQNIVEQAQAAGIPVIFFNRSVSEDVISSYDDAVFVGTDYEMAGHMQGELIGQYVLDNYDDIDLNGDGEISYVMFKGDEANAEAIARTQYGQEDADAVLTGAGKPALVFYDSANNNKYLVDQNGTWSADAANNYMQTILSQYNEANGNMVELVIANNDEMALGSITALQNAGFNLEDGSATVIPVFGVDATDAAKAQIDLGTMTGTIKQDAEGMANTICQIAQNMTNGADKFDSIDSANLVGTWRVNIPYGTYTAD